MRSVLIHPTPLGRQRRRHAGLIVLAVVALAVVVLITVAAAAGAQVAPDGDASPDTPSSAIFTINNLLVTLLLGAVAPVVTGFLLRPGNPEWVKVLVAGLVATLFTAVSQAVQSDGTAALSQEWFVTLALTWISQIGAYLGVWNPLFASRGGLNAATGPGIVPVE